MGQGPVKTTCGLQEDVVSLHPDAGRFPTVGFHVQTQKTANEIVENPFDHP